MNSIRDFLTAERALTVSLIKAFIEDQRQRYATLTPEFSELLTHIDEAILRGGKWHRPALGVLAYRIAGGDMSFPIRQGVMVSEIVHRFLLIHDDIIDRDLVRHNGPTIEAIYADRFASHYTHRPDDMYSKGNAIVAGDVAFSMAYESVLQSPFSDSVKLAAIQGINQLMMETGAGWQLQTEQNYMPIEAVSEEDFFKGMQLVSGMYSVVWPLRMGQIFAGRLRQSAWDSTLETYGWHTGAAFQITDDILGMFGKTEVTGKPVGHDYREGKKTFLLLNTYQRASTEDRRFLQETLGTDIDATTLARVQHLMIETGSLAVNKERAANHSREAIAALENIQSGDQEAIELLRQLSQLLADRVA